MNGYPELAEVWILGREILKASKSLILFGFAFNPYDKALLEFLKKNGETLERILLIDPNPNLDTAKALWPNAILQTVNPLEEFDLEELISELSPRIVK